MRAFAWSLALRYLLSRWVNLLAVGGVAVGVWALIVVIAVFSGFVGTIRDDVRRSSPDLLVTTLPEATSYDALRVVLEGDPDVAATSPRLRHFGVYYLRRALQAGPRTQLAEFRNDDSQFVQVLGIDAEREAAVTPLRQWIARAPAGQRPPDPDRPLHVPDRLEWDARRRVRLDVPRDPAGYRAAWPGLLLSKRRARLLHAFEPGELVDLVTAALPGPADPGGDAVRALHKRFLVTGTFDTGHQLFDENTALVPIEALRTMLGHDALDDLSVDLCTDVAVALRPGADPQQTAARLLAAVRGALGPQAAPEVLTWEQQNTVFLDAVEHERAMMKLVLFAVMLVAAFLIHATLHMMVATKVKDVGVLAALGGAPRAIGAIFVLCGLVVSLLGCVLGLSTGLLSVQWLNPVNDWMERSFGVELFPRTLYDLAQIPVRLEAHWIAQVLLGAFLLSLLAAWRPARKAARLQPVEALAYE